MGPWRLLLAGGIVASTYLVGSCSGEEDKKKELPSPDASAQGGATSGGSSSGGKGGSAGLPQGGGGGEPEGGGGGEPPAGGQGGEAGSGGAMAGQGGEGGASCQPPMNDTFGCADINGAVHFDSATGEFVVDVSRFGTVVDGSLEYQEIIDSDAGRLVNCGTSADEAFRVEGTTAFFSSDATADAVSLTVDILVLEDACGNTFELDVINGSKCSILEFTPPQVRDAGATWPATCALMCAPSCP